MKIALFILATCLVGHAQSASQPATEVSLEQLQKNPEQYSGKRVLVTGYWIQGFEWSYLKADLQKNPDSYIWLESWNLPGSSHRVDTQVIQASVENAYLAAKEETRRSSSCFLIKCIGYFEHVDAHGNHGGFMGGFGHLNGYPSQLVLERILEIHFVPEYKEGR